MKKQYIQYNPPLLLNIILFITPFLCGLYYEWQSCLVTVALSVFLCSHLIITKKITVRFSLSFIAVLLIVSMYGINTFWAVDSGMALLGLVKFLPLILFALLLMQVTNEQRSASLQMICPAGVSMTLLSFLLSQIPAIRDYFMVNGRLSGFFQYPNTYALFLLLGVLVLMQSEKWDIKSTVYLFILVAGILLSGSRAVFVIFVIAVAGVNITALITKKKNASLPVGIITLLCILAVMAYAALAGGLSGPGRFLTSSLESSTFLGRLLYYKDALPVILRSPFGMGYMGYYFTQGTFQTGVYSVVHIHNDILQLMLDTGWAPALFFVFALAKSFFRGRTVVIQKLLLACILAHCLIDFDLQFISIFFVLLLSMDWSDGKEYTFSSKRAGALVLSPVICLSLFFGAANAAYIFGNAELALSVYPAYTFAQLDMLVNANDIKEANYHAEKIIRHNKNSSLAYSTKARIAFSEGNFEEMILNKERAIELTRYSLPEYLDYFDMLLAGISLYTDVNDSHSANYCKERLLAIPAMLDEVLQSTDPLAWRITDKPGLELPERYVKAIGNL